MPPAATPAASLCLVALISFACASADTKLIGRAVDDLIREHGYPDTSIELPSGNRVYVWSGSRRAEIQELQPDGSSRPRAITTSCRTAIEAAPDGFVVRVERGRRCF